MVVNHFSFKSTGYFSSLICDYLDEKEELKFFYNRFPHIDNFKGQIFDKEKSFNHDFRNNLVAVLKKQYKELETSPKTINNIELLGQTNTYTITTGHQLNLFTGPLYFLYKIISTINLTEQLSKKYPTHNFVPIYWMATEDHDFDEINFFNFKNNKIQWKREASGAVGELKTEGLNDVFETFKEKLGAGNHAEYLCKLFKEAYVNHETLAEATRFLANELFKEFGLVCVDANCYDLKKNLIPHLKDEILNKTANKAVLETSKELQAISKAYKVQVNPREINMFYLTKKVRERIVFEEDVYKVLNTDIVFSKEEILEEIEQYPQRFSPNVIMRPLYEEVILPNLCYIGGGGELAYWLQLKQYFKNRKVTFPILSLRNSVLIISKKEYLKLEKLNISLAGLFLKQEELVLEKVKEMSEISIDFTKQKDYLKNQFEHIYTIAKLTDGSFLGAVTAQERKQIKGLESLEKRLVKAQKRKLNDELGRVKFLQNKLFPKQSLQERQANFSSFYLEFGTEFISVLKKELDPLQYKFTVLTI